MITISDRFARYAHEMQSKIDKKERELEREREEAEYNQSLAESVDEDLSEETQRAIRSEIHRIVSKRIENLKEELS